LKFPNEYQAVFYLNDFIRFKCLTYHTCEAKTLPILTGNPKEI